MPSVEVTESELELLELWREQQKDSKRLRLQYMPSLDQPMPSADGDTLGDFQADQTRMQESLSLAATAKRLGIDLPWLTPKAKAVRERYKRTRIEDEEVVCALHGNEDMRHYLRKGKTYVRCYVCKRASQQKYNGPYRRKMKQKIRPCPRCGDAGFFTGPYCKPCHAAYEKARRQKRDRQAARKH